MLYPLQVPTLPGCLFHLISPQFILSFLLKIFYLPDLYIQYNKHYPFLKTIVAQAFTLQIITTCHNQYYQQYFASMICKIQLLVPKVWNATIYSKTHSCFPVKVRMKSCFKEQYSVYRVRLLLQTTRKVERQIISKICSTEFEMHISFSC